MNRPVTLNEDAEEDLASIRDWHGESSGAWHRITDQFSTALERIALYPEMYALVWDDTRSCLLRGFPYLIYYHILPDKIEITAVLHGSRDPATWQRRI